MTVALKEQSEPTSGKDFLVVAKPFLAELEVFFAGIADQFEPELRDLVRYALSHSGKRLRPTVLFLCGADAAERFNDDMIQAAAIVELVHLATLVHDDILDQAEVRHEQATVARKYGVSAAVLLGDALFAQALQLASQFPSTEVCRIVSEATRKVCAGEIEQTLENSSLRFDIDRYFRIIERKTAVLFEASCRLGALLGDPGSGMAGPAGDFGRHLGIAYQIYDDLVDVVGSEATIGKTLGTDFSSGKSTLPILLLYRAVDSADQRTLRKAFEGRESPASFDVSEWMIRHGIVEEVLGYFRDEMEQAKTAVSAFGDPAVRARLYRMAEVVEERFDRLTESPGG